MPCFPSGFNLSDPLLFYYSSVTTANGTSLENTSMGVQRYHGAVSNMSEFRLPPPPVNHPNHNYLFPSVPMQGVRGRRNINFQPPVSTRTYRNSLRNIAIPGQNHLGFGARHVGPTSSASLRMYHPLRGFIPETLGHRNFSPMNFVVVDVIFFNPQYCVTVLFFVDLLKNNVYCLYNVGLLKFNAYVCRMLLYWMTWEIRLIIIVICDWT